MTLLAMGQMLGFNAWQLVALGGMLSGSVALSARKGLENIKKQEIDRQHDKMKLEQKQRELNAYNPALEDEKVRVEQELQQMKLEKKQREINAYNLINSTVDKVMFSPIKPPAYNSLLLGYDNAYNAVWGQGVNYLIAGCTGAGKTRFLYALLLNFLYNNQGQVFLADLKQVDFKRFKNCVTLYIDELEQVKEVIEAFKAEFERRKQLLQDTDSIDIDDYNARNPNKPLKPYILLVDEFADIADSFTKSKQPIGIYKELIALARVCRCTGGRIILATQRPSSDVIIGTLKANCNMIALSVANELNSKIIIDITGAERLEQGQGLTYINGELVKLFSYYISEKSLERLIKKLMVKL